MTLALSPAARDGCSRVRQAVIPVVHTTSNQLFFIYTGQRRGLMINPAQFLERTRLSQRNFAVITDANSGFFQFGVSSTLQSFEALLEWHTTYVSSLSHVSRTFCIGTSMGGYAAILFGYLLAVEEVWSFSPQTVVRTRHLREPSAPIVVRRHDPAADVTTKGKHVPAERADLASLLARSNGRTRYNVFYNESACGDRDAALRIAPYDGVRLWPQAGDGHNVLEQISESGLLESLLPD
jgi:hypothetical protein